jgi:hypothetical protein
MSFEASYKLAPHGASIYNAAVSWEAAGEAARAADAYAEALRTTDLDPADRTAAGARGAALDKTLARISVTAPAGATHPRASLDGGDPRDVPATFHAQPGAHTVVVTSANQATRSVTVQAVAGAETPVDLTPVAPVAPLPPPPVTPASREGGSSTARTLGWVSLGTGVAAVGVGIIVGAVGLSANSQFDAGHDHSASLHDEAVTMRTWANVLLFTGAVVGGTGLVVVLTSGHRGREGSSAWLRVGCGSVVAGGSF